MRGGKTRVCVVMTTQAIFIKTSERTWGIVSMVIVGVEQDVTKMVNFVGHGGSPLPNK